MRTTAVVTGASRGIGEVTARIVDDDRAAFPNGATIEMQDIARIWGLL